MKLPWLYRFERSDLLSKTLIGVYAVMTLGFGVFGFNTLMLIALMGALYEAGMMEIRKLRSEIRRKRSWGEGV